MFKTTALIALLSITSTAQAETLNWNKYRASYVSVNPADETYSPDGFALSASRMISDNVFGLIQFTYITDDATIDGIDTTSETTYFDGAIGYKHTYQETTDFYGSFGLKSYQNDFLAEANDRTRNNIGYAATIGVRTLFLNTIELNANTSRVVFDGDGRWEHTIGAAYHVNRNFSWEASFVKSNYADKIIIGGSFGF
jgi:hypothetical protein